MKNFLLMFLMGTKKWQNPRCQTYHDSYIPGMKLLQRNGTNKPPHDSLHQKKNPRLKIKENKKKNKDKSDETDESPMVLDEEDRTDEKEIPKKRKGFPTIPYLPTKETLTRLSTTSILDHILMTTED